MKKRLFKLTALLLVLLVLMTPVQAEANPLLGSAALSNPYVLGAAAVLCGVGLVISSDEELQQDVQNLWNTASDTVASWLVGQVDSGTGYIDLNSAPPEVYQWIAGQLPPTSVNLVPVNGWPMYGYQFPVSRYGSAVDAKDCFTVMTPDMATNAHIGYGFYLYLSSTQSPLTSVDYLTVYSTFYDAAGNVIEEKSTGGTIRVDSSTSPYEYQKVSLWYAGDTSKVQQMALVDHVQVKMTLAVDRGTYGQQVTVQCGGIAYGASSDPPATLAMPYNYPYIYWANNIDEVVQPVVTPKVGNIAIPRDTSQYRGVDITTNPPAQIINIYNQTVDTTTTAPTIVEDPANLEQGFSFLGTLIRPLTAEVTRIKTAVSDYASTNTAVDWSPITSLTYTFTSKFPWQPYWPSM